MSRAGTKSPCLTAGTILHNTKIPLTVWFWAAYLMATDRRAIVMVVAVENRGGVSGRIRMAVVPNFKQTTMIDFVKHHISSRSTVHTDGLKGFEDLQAAGVKHVRRTQPLRRALRKGSASVVPLADRAIGTTCSTG